MNTIKVISGSTKMIAHRGLSGIELENTNAAFIAAGNRSYYGIETDVHKTADGKFVVIHDDNTGRVCNMDFYVESARFDELRALKLNSKDGMAQRADMKIPTLLEYIATCKRYEKKAVLELKNEFTSEEIFAICEEIKSLDYLEEVIFISFCFENLVRLRSFYPEQCVQFLVDDYSQELAKKLKEHSFDLDIKYTELNKERIDEFHKNGIKVNCWTCDDKDTAQKLISYGIDYITSNILE